MPVVRSSDVNCFNPHACRAWLPPSEDYQNEYGGQSEGGLEESLRWRWDGKGERVGEAYGSGNAYKPSVEMKRILKPNYAMATPSDLRALLSVGNYVTAPRETC